MKNIAGLIFFVDNLSVMCYNTNVNKNKVQKGDI